MSIMSIFFMPMQQDLDIFIQPGQVKLVSQRKDHGPEENPNKGWEDVNTKEQKDDQHADFHNQVHCCLQYVVLWSFIRGYFFIQYGSSLIFP